MGWPAAATPKDFRHLFCTALENAGMPESYRRYLMGHAPGRSALVAYTHLTKLRDAYEDAVRREMMPLVEALRGRARTLGLAP